MFPKVTYKTDLSGEECLDRLKGTASEYRWPKKKPWTRLPEGTVECKFWGPWFSLMAHPPKNVQNSFMPMFWGRLSQCPEGTALEGRYIMHPMVMLILAVWFAIILGILLSTAHGVVAHYTAELPTEAGNVLLPLGFAAAFFLTGVAVVYGGMRLGSKQKEAIDDYLKSTLRAERAAEPCRT
jgi:hypothetical protein